MIKTEEELERERVMRAFKSSFTLLLVGASSYSLKVAVRTNVYNQHYQLQYQLQESPVMDPGGSNRTESWVRYIFNVRMNMRLL